MPRTPRFGSRTRGWVVGGLSLVLLAQAAGCMTFEEWANRTKHHRPTERSAYSELAAADVAESTDDPSGENQDQVSSPESLEQRIQKYVEHFGEDGNLPKSQPEEAATTELTVANRHAEAHPLPPQRNPGQQPLAATPDQAAPAESAPLDDAGMKPDADGQPPATPAREQAAPILLSVSVEPDLLREEGAGGHQAPLAPGEPNRGAEVAVVASPNDIRAIIERLEAKVAQDPNDLEAQIRLRLLYIVGGQDQKAATPPEGLAEETAALMQSLAETIIMARNATADLGLGAGPALEAARDLTRHLSRYAQLTIPQVVLSRRVDSFGVYSPIDPPSFVAGSPISAVVYTELQNYHSQQAEDGSFETRLSQRMELLDADGQRVWQREDGDIVDVSKNRREDFFLAPIIRLPGNLPSGPYHLRIEVQDHLSGKFTSASVPLTILGAGSEQRLSARAVQGRLE